MEESKLSMTKSKIDADASATLPVSESMSKKESHTTDPNKKSSKTLWKTAIAKTIENSDRNDKGLQDYNKELLNIFKGIDGGADCVRCGFNCSTYLKFTYFFVISVIYFNDILLLNNFVQRVRVSSAECRICRVDE
jgi:hypothetical protein